MKYRLVIAVLVLVLSTPCVGAMKLVVAPWGSGYGQYGGLFLPDGGRLGPQSLCVGEDGCLYVLDTFNDGRVISYNAKGVLLGHILNAFPSLGYYEIEIEANRFLFLLDLSRQGVNRIDLFEGTQSFQSFKALGASGAITLLDRDLLGKVFVRDSSGVDIALDPEYDKPLLALEVKDTPAPGEKQLVWRNTRIEFPVNQPDPITALRFLGQLSNGKIFLGVETRKNDLYGWKVLKYSPDDPTPKRSYDLQGLSALRLRKPVALDPTGTLYQLVCNPEDIHIVKRQGETE